MKKIVNNCLLIVVVALVYFITARLGLLLAYPGTNATPLWLPTGIALSAVLLLGNRMWPGVALGAFIANFQLLTELGLSIPASFAASLGAATGNTLEALIGAYLIYRFTGTRNPFGRSSDLLAFIMFGALISTTVSATIGSATFCLSVSDWRNFASMWLTWWLGDAAGAIILVPLAMTFKGLDAAGWKLRPMAIDLLIWALIGVVCYSMFSRSIPLNFILYPVLIIAAFRLGQFGSALAVGVISIVSTYATVNGTGPFSAMTLTEALLLQQVFIGSIATASMVLAAIVSEQKKSELKLSESEKRSRMLIEQAPIGIALSREGITLDANTAYLGMFGFSDIQELRGTPLIDRIASQKRAEAMSDRISRNTQGQTVPASYETMGLRKDGSQFPFYVSFNRIVLADGPLTVSFLIDFTERRRVEEEAKLSAQRIYLLSKYANDFIILLSEDFHFLEFNERVVDFYGYTREELIGMHASQLRADDTRDEFIIQIKLAQVSGKAVYETMHKRKDGRTFPVEVSLRAVDNEGKKFFQAVIRDITERKKTEAELEKHREQLEHLVLERTDDLEKSQLALTNIVEDLNAKKEELAAANNRLKELDKLKSMFIASMSHELRTPLNSIIGFTGMTLQGLSGELNNEQKDNLSRSYQSAKHLLSLITDIIDISKIESGRIDAFPEPVLLNDLIAEAISVVKPQLKEKSLTLEVDAPADIRMKTDKKRLLQCLLNFLSNAIKFTESGTVTVTAREADGKVELTVSDTGIGIAEKDLPRLFEAFERLDTHLRIKAGGTGLGLYLTKKIVTEILHGEVSVQSREGSGSSFTLNVPIDITNII